MIIPMQTEGVRHTAFVTLAYPKDSAAGISGVLPQLRIGPRFPEDPACYYRCRANGVDDLMCRFFCGLRPFTIGGLLIAA
jgi:hypothetical protein